MSRQSDAYVQEVLDSCTSVIQKVAEIRQLCREFQQVEAFNNWADIDQDNADDSYRTLRAELMTMMTSLRQHIKEE